MQVLATEAMATRFELVLADGGDETRLRAAGESALAIVEECEREWSAFRADSFLAHVNREAARRAVPLSDDQFELFAACDDVWRASAGAFDPSVAPLLAALDRRGGELDVVRARESVGWNAVLLDRERRTLRFTREGVALDLGAIAKGHALELAAAELRAAGVVNAFLHGGTSSVLALGAPPDADAWRVALEGGDGAPVVALRDAALSVSAQHGRTLADGSGHVLDPRATTSTPNEALVAIAHRSARLAEAWSTAILVQREPSAAARELDVAVGSGPRFARAWRFTRNRSHSSFARPSTIPA